MKALKIFAKGMIEQLSRAVVPVLVVVAVAIAGGARSQVLLTAMNDRPAVPVKHTEMIVPIGSILPIAAPQSISVLDIMADSVSPEAAREATIQSMNRVIANIVKDNVPGSTELLRSGKALDLTTMIDTERNVAGWHSVNVKASFDARPIGGILDIRVGLAPVFGGVGSAVRSVVFREFDQAIDKFDDDFVAQTISRLSKELAEEFSKNS